MSRFLLPAGFAACLAVALAMPAAPAVAAPPPKEDKELVDKVRDAITNGVRYLKSQQKNGNWEGVVLALVADMEGGQTALVTLALLNCGEKPTDPEVAAALR